MSEDGIARCHEKRVAEWTAEGRRLGIFYNIPSGGATCMVCNGTGSVDPLTNEAIADAEERAHAMKIFMRQRDALLEAAKKLIAEPYDVLPHECAKAWSAWAELNAAVKEIEKEKSDGDKA